MADEQVVETEEQEAERFAAEAYAELEQEAGASPAEKLKKKVEQPDKSESEPETPPEEEESQPEKPEEEPPQEEEKPEGEEQPKEEPAEEPEEDAKLRDMAIKEGLTLDEARERMQGRKSILEKYKNDPAELAKALQSTQSAYDKLRVDHDKLKEAPEVDNIEAQIQNAKAQIPMVVQKNRDEIVTKYREKFPYKSESLTDEAILEEYQAALEQKYDAYATQQKEKVKTVANDRRKEFLSAISEADRQFIPEVKAILDKTPDIEVVSKHFEITDVVKFVRGNHYTPERIAQIEAKAFKRGQEEAKIIAEKTPPGGKAPVKKEGAARAVGSLNNRQRERATEMFPDLAEASAIDHYKDLFKEELKKDPNFIG